MISDHIGHEWKILARTLHMTQTDIDAIEYKDKFSLREQIFQFFRQWQQQKGNGATPGVLVDALGRANMEDILKKLEPYRLVENSGSLNVTVPVV